MSSAKVQVTPNFPVVFYNDDMPEPGWYFRAANETVLYGPFRRKEEAISFGMEAISTGIPATAKPAKTRRAA